MGNEQYQLLSSWHRRYMFHFATISLGSRLLGTIPPLPTVPDIPICYSAMVVEQIHLLRYVLIHPDCLYKVDPANIRIKSPTTI
jgi:hypothetical protein